MATERGGWRLLSWLQPILIAALTGGMVFVGRSGSLEVESTSEEWQSVYTRTVRELILTEEARDECEEQLQSFLPSDS